MKKSLESIIEKECRISLIIEDKLVKDTIISCFKSNGYTNIKHFDSIANFKSQPDWDQTEWLIVSISSSNSPDVLSILKNAVNNRLRMRVSFLSSNQFLRQVAAAFKFGLICWFSSQDLSVSDQSFHIQLEQFLKRIKYCIQKDFHEAKVAAIYYRKALVYLKDWKSLIELELDLCHYFSTQPETMLKLAEAYFLSGMTHRGHIVLDKIRQMDNPNLEQGMAQLINNYAANAHLDQSVAAKFHINSILVIESDESEYLKIREGFASIGLHNFQRFSTYSEAWPIIQSGEIPDMIICEWTKKSKDLHVEQFIQRLRYRYGYRVPVILLVSSIPSKDHQLITDMRVLQIMKKPIRQHNFLMSLIYSIEQHRRPTEPKTCEIKIEQLIVDGDTPYIQYLRTKFLSDKSIDPKRKFYIESYYHYQKHDYEKTKQLLMKGIRITSKDSDSLVMQNLDKKVLLASCFQHLNDPASSIKLLEIAHNSSPTNIEIGINLALQLYECSEKEKALEVLKSMEEVDSLHPKVISCKAQFAVYEGESEHAGGLMENTSNIVDIISAINAQAVKKIKEGSYETGFKIYRTLIRSIPDSASEYRGVVYYNLSLAYIKRDMKEEADTTLRVAISYKGSKTWKKAFIVMKKLDQANRKGLPSSSIFPENEAEVDEITDNEICLHGILDRVQHRSKSILFSDENSVHISHKKSS